MLRHIQRCAEQSVQGRTAPHQSRVRVQITIDFPIIADPTREIAVKCVAVYRTPSHAYVAVAILSCRWVLPG